MEWFSIVKWNDWTISYLEVKLVSAIDWREIGLLLPKQTSEFAQNVKCYLNKDKRKQIESFLFLLFLSPIDQMDK